MRAATNRSSKRRRAGAEPRFHVDRIKVRFGVGPNSYAVRTQGNCLEPVIDEGATLVVDPDLAPTVGDLVAVWPQDPAQIPIVKRLVAALPPREFWSAPGDCAFLLVVEQINPPATMSTTLAGVRAVHPVIGWITPRGEHIAVRGVAGDHAEG